jgi:hypothetical protein
MANDFSGDPNCVALFKFDNNPNDSKGGNDLTAVNSPSYDSGDKKEGTHSIDFERSSTQYCAIADGDLDAGFPGKSGTSEQSFSICGWFKLEAVDVYQGLVCKYVTSSPKRSYGITVNSSGYAAFLIGYNNGANASSIVFDTALSAGIWYHIAAVYDASDNSMKLRIWDDNAGALLDSNKESTANGDMSPTDAPLEVGRYSDGANTEDGKADEVVIFKDVLTDDEIDQIRAGSYGAATEKESSDTGTGTDTVESLETPQAKTSSDNGSGLEAIIARLLTDDESGSAVEAADVEGEGQPKDLSASESGEGTDRLVAKIEMPTKGGGMKLWT